MKRPKKGRILTASESGATEGSATLASVSQIKARFSEFVRRAKDGVETVITEHDRPVAKLVPFVEEGRATDILPASKAFSSVHGFRPSSAQGSDPALAKALAAWLQEDRKGRF
jgi:prevent-host-death family protein